MLICFVLVIHTATPFISIWASSEARSIVRSIFIQIMKKFQLDRCLTQLPHSNQIQPASETRELKLKVRRKACSTQHRNGNTRTENLDIVTGIKTNMIYRSYSTPIFSCNEGSSEAHNVAHKKLTTLTRVSPILKHSSCNNKTSSTLSVPVTCNIADGIDPQSELNKNYSKNINESSNSTMERARHQILSLNTVINSYENVSNKNKCPPSKVNFKEMKASVNRINVTQIDGEVDGVRKQNVYAKNYNDLENIESQEETCAVVNDDHEIHNINVISSSSENPIAHCSNFTVDHEAIPTTKYVPSSYECHEAVKLPTVNNLELFDLRPTLDFYDADKMNKMDVEDPIVRCMNFERQEIRDGKNDPKSTTKVAIHGMSPEDQIAKFD